MKTLDKYRSTNQICITGGVAYDVGQIHAYLRGRAESLIAVANVRGTELGFFYAARVLKSDGGMFDAIYQVVGPEVIPTSEREVILAAREVA